VGACAPSLGAAEAAEEEAPGTGAEAPAAGRSTEEAACAAEAPARAVEVPACAAEVPARVAEASRGAMVAASAMASAPAEPSRKRKRGFSTLR
jgi:hypothetical protein